MLALTGTLQWNKHLAKARATEDISAQATSWHFVETKERRRWSLAEKYTASDSSGQYGRLRTTVDNKGAVVAVSWKWLLPSPILQR